jgi:hypothetical protein
MKWGLHVNRRADSCFGSLFSQVIRVRNKLVAEEATYSLQLVSGSHFQDFAASYILHRSGKMDARDESRDKAKAHRHSSSSGPLAIT